MVAGRHRARGRRAGCAACCVPRTAAGEPELRIAAIRSCRCATVARAPRTARCSSSILGISWFWLFGALFLALFPVYCQEVLGGDERVVTLLLALFSVGIASARCSASACPTASRARPGAVRLDRADVLRASICIRVAGAPPRRRRAARPAAAPGGRARGASSLDLALLGRLRRLLHRAALRADPGARRAEHRSRIIAANNILNAAVHGRRVAAAGGVLRRRRLHDSAALRLLARAQRRRGHLHLPLVPEFLLRFALARWSNVMYRLRSAGASTSRGGPARAGLQPRQLRRLAGHRRGLPAAGRASSWTPLSSRLPLVGLVFRDAKVIPIAPATRGGACWKRPSSASPPELEAGELVCIFPGGRGHARRAAQRFRPGVERIVGRTPVPVVPMAIRGMWGSFFSHKDGPALRRPFRRVWSRI